MAKPARILVVDDEPDTLGLIELTLQTAGFLVQTTSSGSHALSLLREQTYDLVLLDIMMPDMSGFDVLRILRKEKAAIPPVVFLTAKNLSEDRETGLSLGASAYVVKPATRGALLDTIRETLGR